MENKSNQNGGKGRKKPVKKQKPASGDQKKSLSDLIQEHSKLVDEHCKNVDERLKQAQKTREEAAKRLNAAKGQGSIWDSIIKNLEESNRIIKGANERIGQNSQVHQEIIEQQKSMWTKKLIQLINASTKDYQQIEKAISELEKLYGIEPTPKTNHCQYCLFQKLCSLYTEDGRHGLSCPFANYNNGLRQRLREAKEEMENNPDEKIRVYDTTLIYWNDSQEQLDKRFILS